MGEESVEGIETQEKRQESTWTTLIDRQTYDSLDQTGTLQGD